jgi:hypothetical protein
MSPLLPCMSRTASNSSQAMIGVTSRSECAGINRHEVEDERALRERSSDPLGLESCVVTARDTAKRRQRIGGVGIQLRKDAIRTPTSFRCAEGNMNRRANASSCSVRRSRRPQTRLETSCTRTGRPRRHLRLNQAAGRRAKASATRPARTSTRSHTAA